MPLLFIFILVPMIELAVLIKVGSHIGVLWTLALIFLTAIIGVTLLRAQGLAQGPPLRPGSSAASTEMRRV